MQSPPSYSHPVHVAAESWEPFEQQANIAPDIMPDPCPIPTCQDNIPPNDWNTSKSGSIAEENLGTYTQTRTASGFTNTHPTAGQTFGKHKMKWEELEELMKERYPGNPWGVWKSRKEWQIAHWMATKVVTQSDLDELLETDMVS
jgi:hypothetical protein